MHTFSSPERTSSSTNVAANAWVAFQSLMETVTCLPGFSQHGDSWQEVASLVRGRFRWLTPDVEAATLAEADAEVLSLWEREGVPHSHLVGYSQGGRIALWAACRHPERLLSLTTIGAHAGLDGGERARRGEQDCELADQIERQGVDWFADHWAALPMFASLARRGPAFLAQLDAARRRNDPGRLAAQLRGMGAGATVPFWDRLRQISTATLLVAGAEDHRYVAFAQRLRDAIPGAEVAFVPGAGHAAHLERPHTVAAMLEAHLTTGGPASRAEPTTPPSPPCV